MQLETADFVLGATTWQTGQKSKHNAVLDFGLLVPIM